MKKEINYSKLNDLISLSHNILKILFVLLIIIGLYAVIMLIKEVKIFPFIFSILKIIAPFFIGVFIAWLFDPIVTKLDKKGIRRILGTILCYVVFLGIIFLIIYAIIPLLSEQINDFVTTTIPSLYDTSKHWIDNIFNNVGNIEGFDILTIRNEIFKKLELMATNLANSLPDIIVVSITSIFSWVGVFGVGLIIGFYLLLDFDKNIDTIYTIIPKKYRKEVKRCLVAVNKPLKRFVNGALFDCTVVFVITAIGFSIIGLKSPLLFALFCALTNVIPYAGPYIGGAPAVFVGLTQSTPIGIAILIFIICVQAIEGNFFQPLIMSKTTKLSPVTIIVGLLIFGHFFGILGMIISTPLIGAIKELVNFFDDKYDFLNFN